MTGAPASDPVPTSPENTVDDSERSKAVASVQSDPALKRLIGETDFLISNYGPWTTNGASRQIGTFLELTLKDPPAVIDGLWPSMRYIPAEPDPVPYTTYQARLKVTGATQLMVLYDQERDEVVSIQPSPEALVELGPNEPRRPPLPGARD